MNARRNLFLTLLFVCTPVTFIIMQHWAVGAMSMTSSLGPLVVFACLTLLLLIPWFARPRTTAGSLALLAGWLVILGLALSVSSMWFGVIGILLGALAWFYTSYASVVLLPLWFLLLACAAWKSERTSFIITSLVVVLLTSLVTLAQVMEAALTAV